MGWFIINTFLGVISGVLGYTLVWCSVALVWCLVTPSMVFMYRSLKK